MPGALFINYGPARASRASRSGRYTHARARVNAIRPVQAGRAGVLAAVRSAVSYSVRPLILSQASAKTPLPRAERCRSGRTGRSRKPLSLYGFRGFESLPLRQLSLALRRLSDGAAIPAAFPRRRRVPSFGDRASPADFPPFRRCVSPRRLRQVRYRPFPDTSAKTGINRRITGCDDLSARFRRDFSER